MSLSKYVSFEDNGPPINIAKKKKKEAGWAGSSNFVHHIVISK